MWDGAKIHMGDGTLRKPQNGKSLKLMASALRDILEDEWYTNAYLVRRCYNKKFALPESRWASGSRFPKRMVVTENYVATLDGEAQENTNTPDTLLICQRIDGELGPPTRISLGSIIQECQYPPQRGYGGVTSRSIETAIFWASGPESILLYLKVYNFLSCRAPELKPEPEPGAARRWRLIGPVSPQWDRREQEDSRM